MLTEAGHDPEDCRALNEVVARVGDRWTMLVVGVLGAGPLRFNELRRAVLGISQRMLTHTLRGLERDGMVTRKTYMSNPPMVEYALTERTRELLPAIYALAKWGRRHHDAITTARAHYDERAAAQETSATATATEATAGIYRLSMRTR